MQVIAALVPPVLALILLLKVRAHIAAPVILAIGTALAVVVFHATPRSFGTSAWHVAPVALEVLLIIYGGLWLSSLLGHYGANAVVADWLAGVGLSQERMVLLIVLGLTPFAESVTGFGVGAVISIPILLAVGLPPVPAAACGLLGFVAVPWGALAPGTLIGAQVGQVDFTDLGLASAAWSLPTYLICGLGALVITYGLKRSLKWSGDLAGLALTLWGAIWAANYVLGTQLAGAVGSAVAIAVYLLATTRAERVALTMAASVRRALLPYAALCGMIIVGRIGQVLLDAQGFTVLARCVGTPACWLIVTCLCVRRLLGHRADARGQALTSALAALVKWRPVAIATLSYLLLGTWMTSSGMSSSLAEASGRLGPSYLLLAPVIGAVGGFMTGSNSGGNAMFAGSQAQTAHLLGLDATQMVALNNVSGSMATIASSPRITMAVSLIAERRQLVDSTGEPAPRAEQPKNLDTEIFRRVISVVACITATYSLIFFIVHAWQ